MWNGTSVTQFEMKTGEGVVSVSKRCPMPYSMNHAEVLIVPLLRCPYSNSFTQCKGFLGAVYNSSCELMASPGEIRQSINQSINQG